MSGKKLTSRDFIGRSTAIAAGNVVYKAFSQSGETGDR